MLMSIIVLASIGLIVSSYAFYIENELKRNPSYKPICDISHAISCTKPMRSSYAKIFFISNSLMGIIFYLSMIMCAVMHWTLLAFYLSTGACLMSLYLAYILYTRIKSFCLICHILYFVNIGLLIVSYNNLM